LNQKLEQIPELTGEPRKSAIRQAERALEEANELVCRKLRFHLAEFVSRNPPVGW
jgi:ribosome recycling factor